MWYNVEHNAKHQRVKWECRPRTHSIRIKQLNEIYIQSDKLEALGSDAVEMTQMHVANAELLAAKCSWVFQ